MPHPLRTAKRARSPGPNRKSVAGRLPLPVARISLPTRNTAHLEADGIADEGVRAPSYGMSARAFA